MMLELVVGGELYRLLHGDGSDENILPLDHAQFYAAQVHIGTNSVHPLVATK